MFYKLVGSNKPSRVTEKIAEITAQRTFSLQNGPDEPSLSFRARKIGLMLRYIFPDQWFQQSCQRIIGDRFYPEEYVLQKRHVQPAAGCEHLHHQPGQRFVLRLVGQVVHVEPAVWEELEALLLVDTGKVPGGGIEEEILRGGVVVRQEPVNHHPFQYLLDLGR